MVELARGAEIAGGGAVCAGVFLRDSKPIIPRGVGKKAA